MRYICKVHGKYFEWSSIVDMVVSDYMTLDEFESYYKEQYGIHGMSELSRRMLRVERSGSSSQTHDSIDELIPPKILERIERKITRFTSNKRLTNHGKS